MASSRDPSTQNGKAILDRIHDKSRRNQPIRSSTCTEAIARRERYVILGRNPDISASPRFLLRLVSKWRAWSSQSANEICARVLGASYRRSYSNSAQRLGLISRAIWLFTSGMSANADSDCHRDISCPGVAPALQIRIGGGYKDGWRDLFLLSNKRGISPDSTVTLAPRTCHL
jgi:hypothetical protein